VTLTEDSGKIEISYRKWYQMNNDFIRFPEELNRVLFMAKTVFLKSEHKNKKP